MPLLTPTGVLFGFLLGERIAGFAPAVTLLFAFMTFTGALAMNVRDFIAVIRRPLPILIFLFLFHIVMPLGVWGITSLVFHGDTALITGFVLLFSIPTAVAGYIWSSIHKGNGPLALTIILLDTLLAPILTPATVSFLMNTSVQIDSNGMFISLVWMVVIPSIFGILINQTTGGNIPGIVLPVFKPLSKIALLCVVSVNTARIAPSVTAFEPVFFLLIAVSLALTSAAFFLGASASRLAGLARAESITTMYAVGLRNISASLVLALEFFEPRAALPIITGIIFQQTLASLAGLAFFRTSSSKLSA